MSRLDLLLTLSVLAFLAVYAKAQADDYTLCKSTYALCTTARCTPVPGKDDEVSCACEVKTGFSVGHVACQAAKNTAAGKQVQSRYFPVKSLAICSNDRPWADCLDKPCIVDKSDPTKAKCTCTTVKDEGPYVVVGNTYTPSTCTTGIISSATVSGNQRITDFLNSSSELKPFAITVLNPSQSQGSEKPTSGKLDE